MDEATGSPGRGTAEPPDPSGPRDLCPFLRAVDPRGALVEPVARVDARNRCAAGPVPALVGPVVQAETCLVAAHAACPRRLAAVRHAEALAAASAPAEAAVAAAERRRMRPPRAARTVTPAVILSGLFAVACALASIGFVAARGGLVLELPSPSPVAVASAEPTAAGPTPEPTVAPTGEPTPEPTPTPAPTPEPTLMPTPAPTVPSDPLLALPGCPDHPACYLYTVKRGDSLSLIADRFAVPLFLIRDFNPQVVAAGDVVHLGDVLRLGRTRYAILDACPDTPGCWIYVVKSGDTLSGISDRYGVPLDRLRSDNPSVANGLFAGQSLRLIPPEPPY